MDRTTSEGNKVAPAWDWILEKHHAPRSLYQTGAGYSADTRPPRTNTVMRRQMLRTSTLSGDTFIHFTPET